MEEAGVGVEDLHLLLAGPHHVGVAVAHVRHVVDAVQVLAIQISCYKVVLLYIMVVISIIGHSD